MPAHRIARLGGDRASQVLRTCGHPFRRVSETEFFFDRDLIFNRNAAIAALFSGGNTVGLAALNLPQVPNAIAGAVAPNVPEPFLFLTADWLGDGTDVSYFSEIDLANSRHQMLGKILQVGVFGRAFGTNRNLQRMTGVSLVLEDIDKAIATRVRAKASDGKTGKYNYARLYFSVGAGQLTEDYYVPVTCPFKVERATITETSVEFSLIDASDDVLFATIQPPTIYTLIADRAWPSAGTRLALSATNAGNTQFDWFLDDTNSQASKVGIGALASSQQFPQINGIPGIGDLPAVKLDVQPSPSSVVPVPFGGWTKAPYAWGSNATSIANGTLPQARNNPFGVIVLGASKRPDWIQPHYWGDCRNAPASKVRNEPMIYVQLSDRGTIRQLLDYGQGGIWQPNGSTGIGAYIDVHTVVGGPTPTVLSETWYVAVLYVYANQAAGQTGDSNHAARAALMVLDQAASNGRVYVDWNGISASTGWQSSEKSTAAQILGYIAQYHSYTTGAHPVQRGSSAIRGENRIIENYDDALTADGLSAEPLGGSITQAVAGSAVADQICATAMLDQSYSGAGRLALRPAGITARDRLLAIPRAREMTDDEIVEGTWSEGAPKGDDRWGWGNDFRFSGAQDVAKVGGWDGNPGLPWLGSPPAGQVVTRTVEISWKRQDPRALSGGSVDSGVQGQWVLPYQTERQTAQFDLHFGAAIGLELGEYLYVTTYAASNADGSRGWNRKLCRIEGLDVRWPQRTVGVSVLVVQFQYDNQLLLDDESRWVLYAPQNLDTVTLTAGSPNVTFNPAAGTQDRVAASWVNCIFKIAQSYNPKPYPAADFATYLPGTNVVADKVASIIDQLHFALAHNAPFSGTFYAWRIQYSHAAPPPAARFAALFATDPADASPWTKYLQLCDDSTQQFANGDPAQRYQGP